MHRMTSLYGQDANDFVPERWEDNELERKVGFSFVPFHGGPRLCLGKDFALSEASYAIVKIVQTFSNLRLPPQIGKEKTGQVTSAEGCKVLLH
ncbi:Cytochrome P450 52A5 [Lachnellula cervina]|uniref:Cytochrome P450 52A5 n=1 Tax=Lachnellula cervina TaxID=1316786 RepID=A0A7D8UQM6_9HELO|nr:Cytochrome P450 52A5 [Lachnellula cervina]